MPCTFSANSLFSVAPDVAYTFPLNLNFTLNQAKDLKFSGPGIYFMYYHEELIYIGSFFPSGKNRDVRFERFNKELETISMRGKHVTMNNASIRALQLSSNLKNIITQIKGDFQTSKKRIEFADKHWKELQTNDFLKAFTFYWFKKENGSRVDSKSLTHLKNQLIKFYKPTCNGKTSPSYN